MTNQISNPIFFEFVLDSELLTHVNNTSLVVVDCTQHKAEAFIAKLAVHLVGMERSVSPNWGALSDYLVELDVVQAHSIVLAHKKMPELENQDQSYYYIATVADAVSTWSFGKNRGKRNIIPRFLKADQQIVESYLLRWWKETTESPYFDPEKYS